MTETKQERLHYFRLLAHLLIADFQVTEEEQEVLAEAASSLNLSAEDQREALSAVNIDADVGAWVDGLSATRRATVLDDLRAAALADGRFQARERALMERVELLLRG